MPAEVQVERPQLGRGRRLHRIPEIASPGEPVSRFGLAVLCIVLYLSFGAGFDRFLTVDNSLAIALNMSSLAIAAAAAMALLIAGYVDLSIGSMLGLVAIVVAFVARETQDTVLAVLAGLGAGACVGAFNGALVLRLTVNPLIVTLGLLLVYRGAALALTDSTSIFGFPQGFVDIGRSKVAGVPTPVIVAAVVFLVATVILRSTRAGLRVYAMGGDADATRRQGIRVSRYVVALYALSGLSIGLVAVLTTARLGSASPSDGLNFELDVLTAVILGGVAFNGGSGRGLGVLFGIALIGVVNAGLIFAGLEDYYQQIAKGAILLLALAADQLNAHRRALRDARAGRARPDAAGAPPADTTNGTNGLLARGTFSPTTAASRGESPVLAVEGLRVQYGPVVALESATLTVHSGEVVCLVGDNGAGKSTLIKSVSGAIRPGAGSIQIDGRQLQFDDPSDARMAGVETTYQDLALCPNLGTVHNVVLGEEPRRRLAPLIAVRDDGAAKDETERRLGMLGIALDDLHRPVRMLSGGQRQAAAIARALRDGTRLAIFDEPTAALGVSQTRKVLASIRSIAEHGRGVLLVAHDLETVFSIADRIVVMRLGRVVHDGPAADLSELELVQIMAGLTPQASAVAPARAT
jgi:ribose/xylose/arabinose/galactoside ABC-type transport system permease subunit/ABC-type branched-subunit amino acid transport system ATPase component